MSCLLCKSIPGVWFHQSSLSSCSCTHVPPHILDKKVLYWTFSYFLDHFNSLITLYHKIFVDACDVIDRYVWYLHDCGRFFFYYYFFIFGCLAFGWSECLFFLLSNVCNYIVWIVNCLFVMDEGIMRAMVVILSFFSLTRTHFLSWNNFLWAL